MLYKSLVTNLLVMRPGKGRQRSFGNVADFGVFFIYNKSYIATCLKIKLSHLSYLSIQLVSRTVKDFFAF